MNYIETVALEKLKTLQISPQIFKRYIDDIIMGPFSPNFINFNRILEAFNSVDENIQFTIYMYVGL